MRKICKILVPLGMLAMALSSCNDWLDVSPSDEIKEEYLFETGNGYRTALNGIYRKMSTSDLYGRNLSWGLIEGWGQVYDLKYAPDGGGGKEMKKLADFNFKNTELVPTTDAMWTAAWNVVANCNNLAQQVEKEDTTLFYAGQVERDLIFAEAIALRAFVQFDLLRMYAPAPITNPGERAFIPYVDTYPAYVNDKQTVGYCLNHIINDLTRAQEMLSYEEKIDRWTTTSRLEQINAGQARFLSTRGYRLNYFAITAFLARVYLYAQQPDKALAEANKIIDVQNKKNYFKYSSKSDLLNDKKMKLYGDVLFTLYTPELTDWENNINFLTSGASEYEQYFLSWSTKKISEIYGTEKNEDYRFLYQLEEKYNGYRMLKFHKQEGSSNSARWNNPMLPLIRMSEVYYIAAEAIFDTDKAKALDYLEKVKKGRGVYAFDKTKITSKLMLMDEIVKDAQRELLGEGQTFFMFKRLNRSLINFTGRGDYGERIEILPAEAKYVMPLPDSENNI